MKNLRNIREGMSPAKKRKLGIEYSKIETDALNALKRWESWVDDPRAKTECAKFKKTLQKIGADNFKKLVSKSDKKPSSKSSKPNPNPRTTMDWDDYDAM